MRFKEGLFAAAGKGLVRGDPCQRFGKLIGAHFLYGYKALISPALATITLPNMPPPR